MAVDIKRTWYSHVDSQPLAAGASVSEEGQGMVGVLEDGIEKVMPSTGGGGEVFAGFAVFRQLDFTSRPVVEEITVPGAAPYEVDLANTNLITGQVRVYDVAAATDLLVVGVAPAAGEVQVDLATGKLTFNVAEAGKAMVAYYRHELTLAQAKALYYEAPTNYPDANFFASVGVGKGKGRVYTMFYDDSIDWSSGGVIALGADGILTMGGAGPVVPNARVVKLPSAADASLGIEFNV